ncbi:MAG: hypothetical protein ACHQ50_09240 [Fimbriimonadales bacterium]
MECNRDRERRMRPNPSGRVLAATAGFLATTLALAQQAPLGQDPTEPLRRFPISFLVSRSGTDGTFVSLLRLDALHPKDDLEIKVDPDLANKWTFVAATVAAGQQIYVKSWNLWEKRWRNKPIPIGKLPGGDVVPLFFLVLNPHQEGRVSDAIHHALETSAGLLISQTASFESIYRQQNRLLNFMSAYAALGPKQTTDPTLLKYRIAEINADLGMPYNPNAPQTQPGDLQHGLDAGVGILTALRQTPDQPGEAAAIAQQQLPPVVSDWVGLVGSLMRIFVRPPHQVKLTFIPASATEADPTFSHAQADPDEWMQLMTQRVLDTTGDALPALVFRPDYVAVPAATRIPEFTNCAVLCTGTDIAVPLAEGCRSLFLHPWAWDWERSDDGKSFEPLRDARLVPGRGLVFPVDSSIWGDAGDRKLFVRAHVGFALVKPFEVTLVKAFPQKWSADSPANDLSAGDRSATVHLARSGTPQAMYHFTAVTLVDAGGKIMPASSIAFNGEVIATFDLSSALPGRAVIRVDQEEASTPDQFASVFIAPRRPSVSFYYGEGDKELRISGPDAAWVKSVQVPPIFVKESDDSDPGNRRLTLSGTLPPSVKSVGVTYHDPGSGLEWTSTVPVAIGLPRPHIQVTAMAAPPTQVSIGGGADPSWAVATLPAGWFSTKQPVRIQLEAVKPYVWSHDSQLELGLGSAGDVQTVTAMAEGPTFSMDQSNPDAYVTLTMEGGLPPLVKRTSGLVWFRVTRSQLSSAWSLALSAETPMRAVRVPVLQGVENLPAGIRLSFSAADDVLGIKFAGTTAFVAPQLVRSTPAGGLEATVDGPAGATEFDIQVRDAPDGLIHLKIVRPPKGA